MNLFPPYYEKLSKYTTPSPFFLDYVAYILPPTPTQYSRPSNIKCFSYPFLPGDTVCFSFLLIQTEE